MVVKTILIAAFAALVAAVPQNAEHLGKAQVARSNNIFARIDLEGRMISYDGSCGSWSGYTCPDGGCCSSQGWCGSTALHCGAGCQVGFGQCSTGGDTSPAPAPAQSPAPAETPSPVAPAAQPTTTSTTTVAPTTPATTPVVAATSIPVNGGNAPAQNPDKGNDHTIPLPITTAWTAPTTTAAPAPAQTTATSGTNSGLGDTYKLYTGDGSLAAGWPAQSEWVDFDTAFENNRGLMSQSCAQFGAANNNNDEINMLKSALQSVGSSSGVDPRFLLAIVMQESGGCVRAPTTNYGVRNPGLFQSHDGSGTCNDSGNVQNPCASSEITQMVTDGADGTAAGDGLKQTLAEAGTSDVSKYYRAARIYNSGSIASSGQLQDGIATHCYSSDVANRLTGWVHAAHGCSQ